MLVRGHPGQKAQPGSASGAFQLFCGLDSYRLTGSERPHRGMKRPHPLKQVRKRFVPEFWASTLICFFCFAASCISPALAKTKVTAPKKDMALIAAAHKGQKDEVQKLLKEGANVTASDSQGRTALHTAAYNNWADIVQVLLKAPGIDPNAQCNLKCTYHPKATALMIAVLRHAKEARQVLLQDPRVLINTPDTNGRTAFHIAATIGDAEAIRELTSLPRFSEWDANKKDSQGRTALWLAYINARGPAIYAIMAYPKTDPNIMHSGTSLLHQLVWSGSLVIFQDFIKDPRVNVNIVDHRGQTPLFHAAGPDNRKAFLKLLLAHPKIDVAVRSIYGRSAVDISHYQWPFISAWFNRKSKKCARLLRLAP